jgi:hypothetical protein
MVLGKIFSKSQNAIIQRKANLDPVLIAYECVDSIIRLRESDAICKLDFDKAHDHANWDFLMYMLRSGFGEKLCT